MEDVDQFGFEVFNDETIRTAVDLWLNEREEAIREHGDINTWNVSGVSNMSGLFMNQTNFNDNISNWNVSNVLIMVDMFKGASSFNQPIGRWNVSRVAAMDSMFSGASAFNEDIRHWDITNTTSMNEMFSNATAFLEKYPRASSYWIRTIFFEPLVDQTIKTAVLLWFHNREQAIGLYGEISKWNVSKVTDMTELFQTRTQFNDDISNWDVGNVTDMKYMFYNAYAFDQPLEQWNVSNVTNMKAMFSGARAFNQPLNEWERDEPADYSTVGNVTDMRGMFFGAREFNQPIGQWNVDIMTNVESMFRGANAFLQRYPTADNDPRSVFTPNTDSDDIDLEVCPLVKHKPKNGDYLSVKNISLHKYNTNFNDTITGKLIDKNTIKTFKVNNENGKLRFTIQDTKFHGLNPTFEKIPQNEYLKKQHKIFIDNILKSADPTKLFVPPNKRSYFGIDEEILDYPTLPKTDIQVFGGFVNFNDFVNYFIRNTTPNIEEYHLFSINFWSWKKNDDGTYERALSKAMDYSGVFKSFISQLVNSILQEEGMNKGKILENNNNEDISCVSLNNNYDPPTQEMAKNIKRREIEREENNQKIKKEAKEKNIKRLEEQLNNNDSPLEQERINEINHNLQILRNKKDTEIDKSPVENQIINGQEINLIKIGMPDGSMNHSINLRRKVVPNYILGAFLARMITLDPHTKFRNHPDFPHDYNMFIPGLHFDPFILYILRLNSGHINDFSDNNLNIFRYNRILNLIENNQIDLINKIPSDVMASGIASDLINDVLKLKINTMFKVSELKEIYDKIPESSNLRKSKSFKIMEILNEKEQNWNKTYIDSEIRPKFDPIMIECINYYTNIDKDIPDDDNFKQKFLEAQSNNQEKLLFNNIEYFIEYYELKDNEITLKEEYDEEYKIFQKLGNIDLKWEKREILVEFLLQYEFLNLLTSGINLFFFISGFRKNYYDISPSHKDIKKEIDNSQDLFNQKLTDKFIDPSSTFITNLDLDELSVLIGGPTDIDKKDLKNKLIFENPYYIQDFKVYSDKARKLFNDIIDNEEINQLELKSFVEYITSLQTLPSGNIKIKIVNNGISQRFERYDFLGENDELNILKDMQQMYNAHTCGNYIEIDIFSINNPPTELDEKIKKIENTNDENEKQKLKILRDNLIDKILFKATTGSLFYTSAGGGNNELITSLNNFIN